VSLCVEESNDSSTTCRAIERPLHVYSKAPNGSPYSSLTTLYYHRFPYIDSQPACNIQVSKRSPIIPNKFDPRLSLAIRYSSDFVLFYLFNKLKSKKSLNLSSAIIIHNFCNIYRTSISYDTIH